MCVPWLGIEPATSVHQDNALTNWATRPGLTLLFLLTYDQVQFPKDSKTLKGFDTGVSGYHLTGLPPILFLLPSLRPHVHIYWTHPHCQAFFAAFALLSPWRTFEWQVLVYTSYILSRMSTWIQVKCLTLLLTLIQTLWIKGNKHYWEEVTCDHKQTWDWRLARSIILGKLFWALNLMSIKWSKW